MADRDTETTSEVLQEDQKLLEQLTQMSAVASPGTSHVKKTWWTAESAVTMCSIVLVFGLVAIAMSSMLALKRIDKDVILKSVVVPMVVMLAAFFIVAGYTDSQVAPAMGLLGTIIGYVLGTSRGVTDATSHDEPGGRRGPDTKNANPDQ